MTEEAPTRPGGLPRAALVYGSVVVAAGALALGWLLVREPLTTAPSLPLCFLLVCTLLGELRPLPAPFGRDRLEISPCTTSAFAIILAAGSTWGAATLATAALLRAGARRRPWRTAAFSAARYVLAATAAGAVFTAIADHASTSEVPTFTRPAEVAGALSAGVAFLAVNLLLTAPMAAILRRCSLRHAFAEDVPVQVAAQSALLALGPVAVVLGQQALALLPLLLVPLAVAYKTAAVTLEKEHQAMHDSLTGLPNRSMFNQRVADAARGGGRAALLLIDLDRFKDVNDTLGHHIGDLVLRQLGPRLAAIVGAPHTVARLGGDEFGVVLLGADEATAVAVAEEIVEALRQPIDLGIVNLDLGASIGIALCPDQAPEADLLVQRADIAMYAAKERGRDWMTYAAELDHTSPLQLTLVSELRQALEEGQLLLHYQPKVSVATGAVAGVEALVRWEHPKRGLVPPDDFIPVAEQTGLVRPLTEFVLDRALEQCQRWNRLGYPLAVAVNVSARVLHDMDLPSLVARLLRAHRVDQGQLVLEITESSIMVDPVKARATLVELRELGVEVALDDYGTGHSSLAHLKQLPISEIKIDKSFITHMVEDSSDAVIAGSTIDLGRRLGLRVVAEGVETTDSWVQLKELGCDMAQGYLFSRALAPEALTAWMRLHHRDGVAVRVPESWREAMGSTDDLEAEVDSYAEALRRSTS